MSGSQQSGLALAWQQPARRELAFVLRDALREIGVEVKVSFASSDTVFEDASAVFALDEGAFSQAEAVGISRIGLLQDIWWESDGRVADAFRLQAYGAASASESSDRMVRCGVIPEPGYAPSEDLEGLRTEMEIPAGSKVVLLTESALASESLSAWMIQLALVSHQVFWLFHVGRDAALAERVRSQATVQPLAGGVFAEGPECARLWSLADVAVTGRDAREVGRALSVGAPVLGLRVTPPEPSQSIVCLDSLSMLAVELDAALHPERLRDRRAEVAGLELAGSVGRAAEAIVGWFRAGGGSKVAAGLPVGLERLQRGASSPDSREVEAPEMLESKVERELAALKARLQDGDSE